MLRRSPSLTSWVLPTWLCQLTELVSWPGRTRRGSCRSRKYSTEVPQQAGTLADRQIRAWTLTCGGARMEAACLLFASRGAGGRVPLAAQGRSPRFRDAQFHLLARQPRTSDSYALSSVCFPY